MKEDYSEKHVYYGSFSPKDISIFLEEYKAAVSGAMSEEKTHTAVSGVLASVVSILSFAISLYSEKIVSSSVFSDAYPAYFFVAVLFFLIQFILIVLTRYLASSQKKIIQSKRKIIVLRRILSVKYSSIGILPPDNELGADSPFDIKLFTKWNASSCFAFHLLSVASFVSCFILMLILLDSYVFYFFEIPIWISNVLMAFGASIVIVFLQKSVYRAILLDEHESFYLLFVKWLAAFMNLGIKKDFEYVIYRAKLAINELQRINISFDEYFTILIGLEDKEFYKHHGVNVKRTCRAALGFAATRVPKISFRFFASIPKLFAKLAGGCPAWLRIRFKQIGNKIELFCNRMKQILRPSGGGSSITQQLVRTLFIVDYSKTFRRKIIEILLSFWAHSFFSKKMQMKMYLSSVRFEKNVTGLGEAFQYFFEEKIEKPSKAQIFFLIERVSNTNSYLLKYKIIYKLINMKEMSLMDDGDIAEVSNIYKNMIDRRKIRASPEEYNEFHQACTDIYSK